MFKSIVSLRLIGLTCHFSAPKGHLRWDVWEEMRV